MTPVTVTDAVLIRFNLFKKPFFFKCFNNNVSTFESIKSFEPSGLGCHQTVIADNFNARQVMAVADFKVIGVMSRCNL